MDLPPSFSFRSNTMGQWEDGDKAKSKPAQLLKVFAPNGETDKFFGWVGIGPEIKSGGAKVRKCLLFAMWESGEIFPLNYKVVVWNEKEGEMAYSPRRIPKLPEDAIFEDDALREWLKRNPQWPDILELEDFDSEDSSGEGLLP